MPASSCLSLPEYLNQLRQDKSLLDIQRGIEKESLRVNDEGALAESLHPRAFGSKLTHPSITTDFGEAQLEFITGTHSSVDACLDELDGIHRYASQVLDKEYLWPLSMPCMLGEEEDIHLADYGNSNTAQIKSIYRRGLANRYGRLMQIISGIHYNFSFSDEFLQHHAERLGQEFSSEFINDSYMHLIRNFRRYSWLLIYLFGASPAVCGTFVPSGQHRLLPLDEGSYYRPDATSLRMGPLGYQSEAQAELYVTYNSLIEYLRTLRVALTDPYPRYTRLGVKRQGIYQQLTDSLLQIEAEFYSPIRPKRKAEDNERPFCALHSRGIEWVEIRCLDIDPFVPYGVASDTLHFVDAFLLYCLISQSPYDTKQDYLVLLKNQSIVVHDGGALPDLNMDLNNTVPMKDMIAPVLKDVMAVAEVMDEIYGDSDHVNAVQQQMDKVENKKQRPATVLLEAMVEQQRTFSQYGLNLAKEHHRYFQANPLSNAELEGWANKTEESLQAQAKIESAESEPFDSYLMSYLELPEV